MSDIFTQVHYLLLESPPMCNLLARLANIRQGEVSDSDKGSEKQLTYFTTVFITRGKKLLGIAGTNFVPGAVPTTLYFLCNLPIV